MHRSGRSNLGQGGAALQLEKVRKDIHPDTISVLRKRKSMIAEMPEDLRENNMAPPLPVKRQWGSKAKVRIYILTEYCQLIFL